MKNSFDFFLEIALFVVLWWWEPFPLFYSAFLPLSPCFPSFQKKKEKFRCHTIITTLALFADSIKSSQKQRR
jgi:hypothetical protein